MGGVPPRLRTTVPFGHLLALIQHQFQKVFLCHFPNSQNPEIDDQINVATLQFHQRQYVTFTIIKWTLQTRKKVKHILA